MQRSLGGFRRAFRKIPKPPPRSHVWPQKIQSGETQSGVSFDPTGCVWAAHWFATACESSKTYATSLSLDTHSHTQRTPFSLAERILLPAIKNGEDEVRSALRSGIARSPLDREVLYVGRDRCGGISKSSLVCLASATRDWNRRRLRYSSESLLCWRTTLPGTLPPCAILSRA